MLVLLDISPVVEELYGSARFLFLYVACGIGGSLCSTFFGKNLSVSASGAILGVVASLWDVSDRRTAELMSRFYAHLARGESKAGALQSARLELLRRDPNLPPRDWAAFVIMGEPMGTVPLVTPAARLRAVA